MHLEGAIPLTALLFLIEKYNSRDFITLGDIQKKFKYTNFSYFLDIWTWKNQFLREHEDFEFIAEQVAMDLLNQNIRYTEIYFSPTDFSKNNLLTQDIATSIRKGFNKQSDRITINLIADLVRDGEPKLPLLDKIAEVRNQGIIGIGLGGDEKRFPPKLFTEVFQKAKKMGFHTTCHAGEATGSDYIWQAIKDLNVDRIGHGTNAYKDSELVQYLIEKQIPVEMCPISNIRTASVSSLKEHPIYDFYKSGMLVSVNTDDPKMFNTSLENEYISLIDTFNLGLSNIYRLSQNSIKSAWCSESLKNVLSKELSFYFD
ncbi:adenosine deaminase, partial [bacterium]|nr:adenosine deaminase [bacterium]